MGEDARHRAGGADQNRAGGAGVYDRPSRRFPAWALVAVLVAAAALSALFWLW